MVVGEGGIARNSGRVAGGGEWNRSVTNIPFPPSTVAGAISDNIRSTRYSAVPMVDSAAFTNQTTGRLIGAGCACEKLFYFYFYFFSQCSRAGSKPMARLWAEPLLGLKRGLLARADGTGDLHLIAKVQIQRVCHSIT